MFPLTGYDLSDRIENIEKTLLAKGYSPGTILYQAEYHPDDFLAFVISIVLADDKAHLIMSAIFSSLVGVETILRGSYHDAIEEDSGEDIISLTKPDLWLDQIYLSPEKVAFLQGELASLDPFTMPDLYRRPMLGSRITFHGCALKLGSFSAHQFGFHHQPPDPDVLRNKAYFQKILEFAALNLSSPISQRCIVELQLYLN